MTPIFKRVFKSEIYKALIMLMIAIASLMAHTGRVSEYTALVYDIAASSDLSEETFKTISSEKFDKEYIPLRLHYSEYGYYSSMNKYNVYVPDVFFPIRNETVRNLDFAAGMGFALAAACAVHVFAAERRRKGQSFESALPYKRDRLFCERALCGFIVIIVYFVGEFTVLSLWIRHFMPSVRFVAQRMCMPDDYMSEVELFSHIGGRVLTNLRLTLFFYTLMLFMQTLFGRSVYAAIITGGALVGGYWMLAGIADFYNVFLYDTLSGKTFAALGENLSSHITQSRGMLIITVFTAVFAVLAFWLNKHAKIERAGDIFMFTPVKYIAWAGFMVEGAFTFFHFAYYFCNYTPKTLLSGAFLIVSGALLALLMLKNLILKGD